MSEQLPPEATLDMLYEVAMSCETQPEAQACLARLVDTLVRFKGMTAEAARKDVLDTLGYTAAYGSHDQRLRIERLFGAVHPPSRIGRGWPGVSRRGIRRRAAPGARGKGREAAVASGQRPTSLPIDEASWPLLLPIRKAELGILLP